MATEKGDRVLHGTACSHFFHIGCIMEWMEKAHDHCPFCREPMVTPQDMRAAAVEALGKKRVDELSFGCTPPFLRPTQTSALVIVVDSSAATGGTRATTATMISHAGTVTAPTESAPHNSETDAESATKGETESHQDEASQSQLAEVVSEELVDGDDTERSIPTVAANEDTPEAAADEEEMNNMSEQDPSATPDADTKISEDLKGAHGSQEDVEA